MLPLTKQTPNLRLQPISTSYLDNRLDLINVVDQLDLYRFLQLPLGKTKSTVLENATWSLEREKGTVTQYLTFFPQNKDKVNQGYRALWQTKVVTYHELAHHLFYEIFSGSGSNEYQSDFKEKNEYSNQLVPARIFTEYDLKSEMRSKSKGIDKRNIIGSINEAFADIVSQLLGGKIAEIEGTECFEMTRDIYEANFRNGRPKKFDSDTLEEILYLTNEDKNQEHCADFQAASLHKKGAIFAYIFTKASQTLNLSNEDKAKASVEWIKAFSEQYDAAIYGTVDTLDLSLSTLISSILAFSQRAPTSANCEILNELVDVNSFNLTETSTTLKSICDD